MKRLSIFLVLLLSVIAVYAGGIGNAKEFIAFAKAVNSGADISEWTDDKGVVCLECDIDMKKASTFPTIVAFKGTFDGKGYTLKNWKANNALFQELKEGGVICNLRIDESCVMKLSSNSGEFIRALWLDKASCRRTRGLHLSRRSLRYQPLHPHRLQEWR